ncbi:hypothetical protein Tco_0582533, partial [Tanacetum coccineum]
SFKSRLMNMEAMMEVRRIFKCWFHDHTTNGHQFTMSNRHQELASPEQTASGKDFSNPLMADSLPKTICEDLGKVKAKADIGIFIGYSPSKKAYRIYNKRTQMIMEIIHVHLGLVQNQAASTSANPPSKNDLDMLFQPMFDEYFKHSPSVVSTTVSIATLSLPDTVRASLSTTIAQDAPSSSPTTSLTKTLIQSTNVEEPNNQNKDTKFDSDTFTNPFAPLVTSSAESSSRIIDTLNMHTFQQP